MNELDCYLAQRYLCIHYDGIKERLQRTEDRLRIKEKESLEDVMLQMEWQR